MTKPKEWFMVYRHGQVFPQVPISVWIPLPVPDIPDVYILLEAV